MFSCHCRIYLESKIEFQSVLPALPSQNPCMPSPCGPHSICRVMNDRAVCSCSPGYHGTSPNCRPECLVSSECPAHLACIGQKCGDPCPGLCGQNALCQVVNHNPICSCPSDYLGDPFTQCVKEGNLIEFFNSLKIFINDSKTTKFMKYLPNEIFKSLSLGSTSLVVFIKI